MCSRPKLPPPPAPPPPAPPPPVTTATKVENKTLKRRQTSKKRGTSALTVSRRPSVNTGSSGTGANISY